MSTLKENEDMGAIYKTYEVIFILNGSSPERDTCRSRRLSGALGEQSSAIGTE